MIISRINIIFFISAFIYKALLDAGYVLFVYEKYSYSGFEYSFEYWKYVISNFFCLLAILIAPKTIKTPSAFFIHIILFSWLFPFFSYAGLSSSSLEYQIYMFTSFLFIVLITKIKIHFRYLILNSNYIWGLTIILVAIVTVNFLQPSSLKYMNFDLRKVYEYRSLAGEVTNQGIFAYLNKWAFKLLGPLLIIFTLYKKKYHFVVFIALLHFFWFSVSGHKSVIFYPFVTIFIYIMFNSPSLNKSTIIPIFLSAVIVCSLLVYLLFDYGFIASLFIRRVFFIPTYLSFEYYDFFKNTNFLLWSYKTEIFTNYPYEVTPAKVIGAHLGNPNTNANNSFLSNGYMNAGLVGMLIYSVIFSFILIIFDKIHRSGVPIWAVTGITVNTMHSIIKSSDLITGIITHGLGITILILLLLTPYFYRKSINENYSHNICS